MFQENENADTLAGSDPSNGDSKADYGDVVELERDEIPPNDITFDCPHCGKNHSIDPRGAGLVINCTDCGEPVTVPIPEGLEIEDFDATPEELSAQLFTARKKIHRQDERIRELENEVRALKTVEAKSKERDDEDSAFFAILHNKLATLSTFNNNAAALVKEISALIAEE
ncbi:MAG: transcription elongation factor 1 family protein [Kiritimatiellaeota bacterium]|nr:transcription elongation factor 1 family protein [Kiritimatiellota bacterium]